MRKVLMMLFVVGGIGFTLLAGIVVGGFLAYGWLATPAATPVVAPVTTLEAATPLIATGEQRDGLGVVRLSSRRLHRKRRRSP